MNILLLHGGVRLTLRRRTTLRPDAGQGTLEFLLAIVPVMLLGLGSIEAIHWYAARQAVSLALVQAARAAITQHANPEVLDQAFTEALLPLHAGPTAAASRARLQRAVERRTQATGLPPWRIRILSPSTASFVDFASSSPDLPRPGRLPVIDNDYLRERHRAGAMQPPATASRGPVSGQTLLEANTLVLHLTWLHEPLLPGMRALLRQLAPADNRYGSVAMARGGYLPLQREVALVMQSHPIAWNMPAHGRVLRLGGGDTSHPGHIEAADTIPAVPPATPAPSVPEGDGNASANESNAAAISPGFATGGNTEQCAGLWCLMESGLTPLSPTPYRPPAAAEAGGPAAPAREPGAAAPPATELDDCPACCG